MMDEVCKTSNDSIRVKETTTFPCQTGWVTFDEPNKESRVIECPAEEKPSEENGRYLSLLGKFDIEVYMGQFNNVIKGLFFGYQTLNIKSHIIFLPYHAKNR